MSTLQNQLAVTEREETGRAIRLLLRTPMLRQETAPEDYELVRRRRVAVTAWFESYLGWGVEIQPRTGYVRLLKVPSARADEGDWRPARRARSGAAFDRLRYVLLCVVASELVNRRAVALGELAQAVVYACAVDDELPAFETDRHQHRKAFVDAVLVLESLGTLTAVDGRTESFADDLASAVLYRVDAAVLFHLLASPVGASQVAEHAEGATFAQALDGLLAEPTYGGSRGEVAGDESAETRSRRNLWLRHSALRALFDDPVLYRDSLTDGQRDYLDSISGRQQLRQAADLAGFLLEVRAEGFLLVDPDRISTDEQFPADGAASLAALHLINGLTRDRPGTADLTDLRGRVADLLANNRGWARTYQDEDGADRLLLDALALLARHHMVVRTGDEVTVRPAAFRYRSASLEGAPGRARHVAPQIARTTLFDEQPDDAAGGPPA